MNETLDIANVAIEEDKDWLAKIKHTPTVTYTGNGNDLIEDYQYARDVLRGLISSGEFALAKMENALKDEPGAATFDVFAKLISSISDLTADLIKLQKEMKSLISPMNVKSEKEDSDDDIIITTDQLNRLLKKE